MKESCGSVQQEAIEVEHIEVEYLKKVLLERELREDTAGSYRSRALE